jgi:hypothetical protein
MEMQFSAGNFNDFFKAMLRGGPPECTGNNCTEIEDPIKNLGSSVPFDLFNNLRKNNYIFKKTFTQTLNVPAIAKLEDDWQHSSRLEINSPVIDVEGMPFKIRCSPGEKQLYMKIAVVRPNKNWNHILVWSVFGGRDHRFMMTPRIIHPINGTIALNAPMEMMIAEKNDKGEWNMSIVIQQFVHYSTDRSQLSIVDNLLQARYGSEDTYDTTLSCRKNGSEKGQDLVRANRFVLSLRSPVFYKLFYGSLAGIEKTEGKVSCNEYQHFAVLAMVQHCYSVPFSSWFKLLQNSGSLCFDAIKMAMFYEMFDMATELSACFDKCLQAKKEDVMLARVAKKFAQLFKSSPNAETKQQQPQKSENENEWKVNDYVSVQWKDGDNYPANIQSISDSKVQIEYTVDLVKENVDRKRLSLAPPTIDEMKQGIFNGSKYDAIVPIVESLEQQQSKCAKLLEDSVNRFMSKHLDVVVDMLSDE